ncbi:hypothetical protein [Spirillospora sp. CA-294931]|uniref:hypothetical protein n=1 Tax=Spirillospora sp. CA-294931 TaxID=3240042 RepID=UPI003D9384A8
MRRAVYAGLGFMVVATGGYLVVYTARWEWQRALMAGELLLVTLIVLLTVAGARRLREMEERLTRRIEAAQRETGVPAQARLAAVPSPHAYGDPQPVPDAPRFRWLQPDSTSYGVFIPVLLGAGIAVAGLAALVERVAAAFGRAPAPGTSRVPSSLAFPAGGVLAGAPEPASPRTRPWAPRVVAGALAALLIATLVIVELAERTQDRPDAPVAAAATTLVIEARTRGLTGAPSADPLATRLWEYCRGSTRPYLRQGGLAPLGGQRYALVVQPALGEHSLRRLRGCLEDAVVDRAQFRVTSVQPR